MLNWLFYGNKRKREIEHNCALAEAALIEPVYENGSPETFLIKVRDEMKDNEVAWFFSIIDKRIGAMCLEDAERYERQLLAGGLPTEPLMLDARRVVIRDLSSVSREASTLLMQWTPKTHYNIKP